VTINEKPRSKAPGDKEALEGEKKGKADKVCEKKSVSKKKRQSSTAAAPPGAAGGP